MKKCAYIFVCLNIATGLISFTFAQTTPPVPPSPPTQTTPPTPPSPPSPAVHPMPTQIQEIPYDKEPMVIKRVEPVYPSSMLRAGLEATVYMKAFINIDSSVAESNSEKIQVFTTKKTQQTDESIDQKSEGKAFEEAAHTALQQWKFSPAELQGKPVAVWVTIPFRFKLKAEDKVDKAEMQKSVDFLKTVIENILKGTNLEKAKMYATKKALLIYNGKTLNLYSVLNGEQKNVHLTEGKETQCIDFNINMIDGGRSALIVCTSQIPNKKSTHIHSIILSKDETNGWKITHWHASF